MTRRASPNAKYVALWGYFSCIPISRPHPYPLPSPLSSSISPFSHFTTHLPFSVKVNKKLSYRGRKAFSINETRTQYRQRTCIVLSVRQSRLAGGIMLSTCPFVRLLPTCERYTSKTNELISMQICYNLPPGPRA